MTPDPSADSPDPVPGTAVPAAQVAPPAQARPGPEANAPELSPSPTEAMSYPPALVALLLLCAGMIGWLVYQNHTLRSQVESAQREWSEHDAQLGQRMATLEQQWADAQADADGVGALDPKVRERREALAWVDVERLVELAQAELRSGAPVAAAIDALGAADARLAHLSTPAAQKVQVALRADLARLRGATDADFPDQAAKVDVLLGQLPAWPMLADGGRPLRSGPVSPAASAAPVAAAGSRHDAPSAGARLRAWIESEFGDLLRIRRVDTPQALLLDPAQQQLVQERARLGLLALRQGLLSRNDRLVRSEGTLLLDLMRQYYDHGNPQVDEAVATVRSLVAAPARAPMPSVDESLRVVREVRGAAAAASRGA